MIKALDMVRSAPKYLGTAYSKLDCQAFVEACMRDAGEGKNLAGSNAWYRECIRNGWVGTPEECRNRFGCIPKGAFLFILKASGNEPERYKGDGIGNASHIGLYTGETGKEMADQATIDGVVGAYRYDYGNGAMHSSSSRGCVCTSKFAGKTINDGWNRVGLWKHIDYGEGVNRILGGESGGGKVEPYKAKVVGGTLNLREEPSTSAKRIGRIPDGTILTVTEENGTGWAKVECDGYTGWVMKNYLEPTTDGGAETVAVRRKELETIYDTIGDWLGLRG